MPTFPWLQPLQSTCQLSEAACLPFDRGVIRSDSIRSRLVCTCTSCDARRHA